MNRPLGSGFQIRPGKRLALMQLRVFALLAVWGALGFVPKLVPSLVALGHASESMPGMNDEDLNVVDQSPRDGDRYEPVDADVAGMPLPEMPVPVAAAAETTAATEATDRPDAPEIVQETVAEEAAEMTSPASTAQNQAEMDPRRPRYTQVRPRGSISVIGTTRALGGRDIVAGQNGVVTRAFGFQAEYLPRAVQSLGVVSFGASVTMYPIFPRSSVTSGHLSLWSAGLQARYQLRFLYEQVLVPTAAFHFEHLRYSLVSGRSGGLNLMGPAFGVLLLLNNLDPFDREAAAEFYSDFGAKRTYLLVEARAMTGSDANVNVTGTSLFGGIRVEY